MGSFLCESCTGVDDLSHNDYGCIDFIPNFEPYRFFLIPCTWFNRNPAVIAPPAIYCAWDDTLPLTARESDKRDFLEEVVSENRIIILQPSADPISVSPTTTTIPAIGCNGESTLTTGESFTFTQQWNADYATSPYSDLSADWRTPDQETGTQAQTAIYELINKHRTHLVGYVDCSGNLYVAHKNTLEDSWDNATIFARVEATRIAPSGSVPSLVTKYQIKVDMGKNLFLAGAGFRAWTNLKTLGSSILNAAFA